MSTPKIENVFWKAPSERVRMARRWRGSTESSGQIVKSGLCAPFRKRSETNLGP